MATAWVNLGPVGRPLGVHGAFLIHESTLEAPSLKLLKSIRLGETAPEEPVVEAVRHGAGLKLRIARITSPEAARKELQGKSVWIPREILPTPEDGSYYHFELLGCDVVANGAVVGRLTRIEEVHGGVDRWWVKTANDDVAVPAAKRFIQSVNPQQGRIELAEWETLLNFEGGTEGDEQ